MSQPIVRVGVNLGVIQWDYVYNGYQDVPFRDGNIGVSDPYRYIEITGPARVTVFWEQNYIINKQYVFEVQEGITEQYYLPDFDIEWFGSAKIETLDILPPQPEDTVQFILDEDFPGHKRDVKVGEYGSFVLNYQDNLYNILSIIGPVKVELFSNNDWSGDRIVFQHELLDERIILIGVNYNWRGKPKSYRLSPPDDEPETGIKPEPIVPEDHVIVRFTGLTMQDDLVWYHKYGNFALNTEALPYPRVILTGPGKLIMKAGQQEIFFNNPEVDVEKEVNLQELKWHDKIEEIIIKETDNTGDNLIKYVEPDITGSIKCPPGYYKDHNGNCVEIKKSGLLNQLPVKSYMFIIGALGGFLIYY